MDKAELRRLLEQQVQDKIKEGYSVTTYALDAASRDSLKRGLKAKGHEVPNENHAAEAWDDYIHHLDVESHKPAAPRALREVVVPEQSIQPASSSAGLWKARRH